MIELYKHIGEAGTEQQRYIAALKEKDNNETLTLEKVALRYKAIIQNARLV
jgi:hypothetical protein